VSRVGAAAQMKAMKQVGFHSQKFLICLDFSSRNVWIPDYSFSFKCASISVFFSSISGGWFHEAGVGPVP
jgi:hypothetical protein